MIETVYPMFLEEETATLYTVGSVWHGSFGWCETLWCSHLYRT